MPVTASATDGRRFELKADYSPAGDQPAAINALTENLESGLRYQTLLGVTGSGKTFSIANVIAAKTDTSDSLVRI